VLSDPELTDREVMRWFRDLPGEQQGFVSVDRRARGYTATSPRRRVPDGRNVWCRYCATSEPVWFTNESGDPARRAAQVAAARHLHRHLTANPDGTGVHVNAPPPGARSDLPVRPRGF
jgi:hypothetical protein